ncbi:MAG: metal ABC transporter ATP-binding protein, partial [Rubrimonas sp.]
MNAPAAVDAALLSAQGLSVGFGGAPVLRDVDFSIAPAEIVTVVGPNGSGKTTLLRALIGALPVRTGTIRRRPGLRIGYVPQKLALDRTMPLTVDRFLGLAGAGRADRAQALARVGIEGLGGRQMTDLSGGQMQRALLAHALLRRPHLLALDE